MAYHGIRTRRCDLKNMLGGHGRSLITTHYDSSDPVSSVCEALNNQWSHLQKVDSNDWHLEQHFIANVVAPCDAPAAALLPSPSPEAPGHPPQQPGIIIGRAPIILSYISPSDCKARMH